MLDVKKCLACYIQCCKLSRVLSGTDSSIHYRNVQFDVLRPLLSEHAKGSCVPIMLKLDAEMDQAILVGPETL